MFDYSYRSCGNRSAKMHDINTRIFYTTKTRKESNRSSVSTSTSTTTSRIQVQYISFITLHFTLHYLDSASYRPQEHAQWQQLLCHQLNSLWVRDCSAYMQCSALLFYVYQSTLTIQSDKFIFFCHRGLEGLYGCTVVREREREIEKESEAERERGKKKIKEGIRWLRND